MINCFWGTCFNNLQHLVHKCAHISVLRKSFNYLHPFLAIKHTENWCAKLPKVIAYLFYQRGVFFVDHNAKNQRQNNIEVKCKILTFRFLNIWITSVLDLICQVTNWNFTKYKIFCTCNDVRIKNMIILFSCYPFCSYFLFKFL